MVVPSCLLPSNGSVGAGELLLHLMFATRLSGATSAFAWPVIVLLSHITPLPLKTKKGIRGDQQNKGAPEEICAAKGTKYHTNDAKQRKYQVK